MATRRWDGACASPPGAARSIVAVDARATRVRGVRMHRPQTLTSDESGVDEFRQLVSLSARMRASLVALAFAALVAVVLAADGPSVRDLCNNECPLKAEAVSASSVLLPSRNGGRRRTDPLALAHCAHSGHSLSPREGIRCPPERPRRSWRRHRGRRHYHHHHLLQGSLRPCSLRSDSAAGDLLDQGQDYRQQHVRCALSSPNADSPSTSSSLAPCSPARSTRASP